MSGGFKYAPSPLLLCIILHRDSGSQDSPDQCQMPINADQNYGIDPKCLSMPIIADQFLSMPDQGISKTLVNTVSTLQVAAALHRNWYQCRSMPSNADQYRSMPINARSIVLDLALIGIDQHWSTLIRIDRNRSALIGIDQNWSALGSMPGLWSALIEGVLGSVTLSSIITCFKTHVALKSALKVILSTPWANFRLINVNQGLSMLIKVNPKSWSSSNTKTYLTTCRLEYCEINID